jgi:hypothetical protein
MLKALDLGLAHAVTLQEDDTAHVTSPLGRPLRPDGSPISLPVPPSSF